MIEIAKVTKMLANHFATVSREEFISNLFLREIGI